MISHHRNVRTPFFLQANEDSHPDGMHPGLSHAVETVDTPLEFRLHAPRMVDVVVRLVVRFLKANDSVHPVCLQFFILFGLERHHFYLQVAEVGFGQIQGTRQIRHAGFGRILSCHYQEILERRKLLDGLVFVLYLLLRENGAAHRVADMETAIHTGVGAGVGNIQRYEHGHGLAETLFGIFTAQPRHRLQIGSGCRGHQSHEIVHVTMFFREGAAHIGLRLGVDPRRGFLP